MNSQDEMIRARAYEIWKAAGCPDGQDEAHWHQAASEMEEAPAAVSSPMQEDPPLASEKPAARRGRR